MKPRSVNIAWKIILIADLAVLLYGVLAVLSPDALLSESYAKFYGQSWSTLLSENQKLAEYVLLLGRLVGAFNVAFAILAIAIVLKSFRKKEPWSWYALLIGNTIGYGAPIIRDFIVGAIGFFEQLEIILFILVYVALGISAKDVLSRKSAQS